MEFQIWSKNSTMHEALRTLQSVQTRSNVPPHHHADKLVFLTAKDRYLGKSSIFGKSTVSLAGIVRVTKYFRMSEWAKISKYPSVLEAALQWINQADLYEDNYWHHYFTILRRKAHTLAKEFLLEFLMQEWQDIANLRNRLDEPDQAPAAETGCSTQHTPFHNIITMDGGIRICAGESEAGLTTDTAFHRPSEEVYYRLPVVIPYDSPIFIYVQNGDIHGMRMLLTQGSIDVVDPYGLGLLYYSTFYCWRNHGVATSMEVTKALLQADACGWADDIGNTPMDSLIEAVLVESAVSRQPLRPGLIEVGILFEKPVDDLWSDYNESRGFTELHKVLLCINQDSEPLINYLFRAASEGRLRDIIDAPDRFGRSALSFAVEYGLADAVAILIGFGADIHQHRLSLHGAQPMLHLALAGPNSGQRGTPCLDIVEKLIWAGADVNAVDHEGWTPIHVAASWKDYRAAFTLLELGGPRLDLSAVTNDGESAAQLAAGADEALIELLVGQINLLSF